METVRNNKIIKKKYLQFFYSVLFSVLILQVTTIVDSIIVGTLIGTKEMSGVKASNPIISFVAVFATLIAVGLSNVISISLGKRNNKKASSAFTYGLLLCIGIGLLFTLIGIILSDVIVSTITSNADILEYAQRYVRIVIISSPFIMLASYLGYAIRSDGFSRLSMTLLIASGFINVCFDLIFILAFKLGVDGAAIATDISYVSSNLIGCIYFLKKNRNLHLVNIFKKDSEIKDITIRFLKNGYPSASRLLFNSISLIIINFIVGKYVGYMGIAVFSVISNIGLISSAVFQSSGASMMPIMGVLYGEKDYKGIGLLVKFVFLFLLMLILVIVLLIEILAPLFFPLFGIKDAPNEYVIILRLYAIGFIFTGINYILLYYYTTLQKSYLGIIITLLEQIIILVPLNLILIPNIGLYGLVIAFIASEFGTTLITLLIVYIIKQKKNYKNILLLPKERSDVLLDFTILASKIDAVEVSKNVLSILIENKIDKNKANRISLILEEMIINTIKEKEKHNTSYVDIKIIKGEENVIISLRSNGNPYNPLIENEEDISQKIISSFAIKLKYNQIMGFNQTLIEV